MCGIVAVLRRRSRRPAPTVAAIRAPLGRALGRDLGPGEDLPARLAAVTAELASVDRRLIGPPGIACLLAAPALSAEVDAAVRRIERDLDAIELRLDERGSELDPRELERTNAALVAARDAAWAVGRDRLRTAAAVGDLAGPAPAPAAIEAYASIQCALSALDRLEVRGRDSAGLHVYVEDHELDPTAAAVVARVRDPRFGSGSVRVVGTALSFVYKHAAEIGELGDNVAALRAAIRGDELLRAALRGDRAFATVLAHTRWASVGIISEANAHPHNSELDGQELPYVVAALNGDVDNHAELAAAHGLTPHPEITTDAKVIPALIGRRLAAGLGAEPAFATTVFEFEGSVAIAAAAANDRGRLHLALRGSGQALYVGLGEDAFVVASEPYGVVEEAARYLRMDGETPGNPASPAASRGQVVTLDRSGAGTVEGITRRAYDGTPLPLDGAGLTAAAMTTRDVDRGEYPHFLLKEISSAPRSFAKTLRGRIRDENGRLAVTLGDDALPAPVATRLRSGTIRRIAVIGQGTACVAGHGVAAALRSALGAAPVAVEAMPATELSGFALRDDMSDTLVLAVSQSGTTTDTNRTVDLVRARGASVLAIVNRRGSDLCDKADGVLFTSDGRDIEMSVASTKAFYAQIAAGFLYAFAIARAAGAGDRAREHEILTSLRSLPAAMGEVLATRAEIAACARELAPSRRYWALVGSGADRIAADEIRIKLSELCYKSIACDATEDKKHIDLSSEPLILVCAAGLRGSIADDVAKEVAIYRAHKAAPVVIATRGEERYTAACRVLAVPEVHPRLAFVLSAMAGHLFGYEAARAIDATAQPLREARAAIERAARSGGDGEAVLAELRQDLVRTAGEFHAHLRCGRYDGQLEASTATRLDSIWRYALGLTPIDSYQVEQGKNGTPAVVIDDLAAALTTAIEQLTRPVDAIKHQAKTVTVGISRSDEGLLTAALVRAVLDAGVARDRLGYRDLRTLAALSPAIAEVTGGSRYRVTVDGDGGTVEQLAATGVAAALVSRTRADPTLKGTKHQVAREQQVLVSRGRSDGRLVLLVPEVHNRETTGITLLHVTCRDRLDAATLRGVLSGYRNRYAVLYDAVTETEPTFAAELLEAIPVVDLLTVPVHDLADRWHAVRRDG